MSGSYTIQPDLLDGALSRLDNIEGIVEMTENLANRTASGGSWKLAHKQATECGLYAPDCAPRKGKLRKGAVIKALKRSLVYWQRAYTFAGNQTVRAWDIVGERLAKSIFEYVKTPRLQEQAEDMIGRLCLMLEAIERDKPDLTRLAMEYDEAARALPQAITAACRTRGPLFRYNTNLPAASVAA